MHFLLWKHSSKQGTRGEINTVHRWITTNHFIKNGIPFYKMVAVETISCSSLLFNQELSGFWKKSRFKEYFVDGVVEIPSIHVLNVKRAEGRPSCTQNKYTGENFLKALWRPPERLEDSAGSEPAVCTHRKWDTFLPPFYVYLNKTLSS